MRKTLSKFRIFTIILGIFTLLLLMLQAQIAWRHAQLKQVLQMRAQAILKPTKVFQIGFSKCGTTTLAYFFNKNGVTTVHHDNGWLPRSIHENYLLKRPLLAHRYQNVYVFTDMEHMYAKPLVNVGLQYYQELDRQYPGSKFILNTRNKDAWLRSRAKQPIKHSQEPLTLLSARLHSLTSAQMEAQWSIQWDTHHLDVIEYFKNRPHDLLVFDIDKDSAQKLVEFFKDDFKLDPQHYLLRNKTCFRSIKLFFAKVEEASYRLARKILIENGAYAHIAD